MLTSCVTTTQPGRSGIRQHFAVVRFGKPDVSQAEDFSVGIAKEVPLENSFVEVLVRRAIG